MAYCGLSDFISDLDKHRELIRIRTFVDPVLEIAEIADRVVKNRGKALLFENNGTSFPVLINAYGSDNRMAMAIGRGNLEEAGTDITSLFNNLLKRRGTLFNKLSSLSDLARVAGFMPSQSVKKGICQEVIHREPDLDILPVLKCWPNDGGRYLTLPVVHTVHPESGSTNAGMYRMQVLGKNITGMHWQRHKTGARHYDAWKAHGGSMPVTVTLGGDPVYAYAACAPLPENISEYILAGFLRKKRVRLVKCITNDLFIPCDADIVIEGYIDPSEELIREGSFGDHTGFYSLTDWYPKFHVTCITHSRQAVFPATIVGIPPQEDAWLTKATERIFFYPLKLTVQPEIEDFHLPDAGVAHNLVIVKINKTYPGQGMKVISSLFGAGQLMFTKYLVVVSGDVNIRNYKELLLHLFENTCFKTDLLFSSGPLDVLDHSSEKFSFGGKVGIDATIKLDEEPGGMEKTDFGKLPEISGIKELISKRIGIPLTSINMPDLGLPVLIIGLDQTHDSGIVEESKAFFREEKMTPSFRLIIAVSHLVDVNDIFTVAWQVLGNSDPQRDIESVSDNSVYIDGTLKIYRPGGFSRRWPNVVCSSDETIGRVDQKWEALNIGPFVPSPSKKFSRLVIGEKDEVIISDL